MFGILAFLGTQVNGVLMLLHDLVPCIFGSEDSEIDLHNKEVWRVIEQLDQCLYWMTRH